MKEIPKFQSRWEKLDGMRSALLTRARLCAALTIPHLLPPEGYDENTELPTPYQSHGARCVNNLSSKLWLTLFPPNASYFRLSPSPELLRQIEAQPTGGSLKTSIETALADVETTALKFMETHGIRSPAQQALKHLITTGNVLVYMPPARKDHHPWHTPTAGMKLFRMDQFTTVRDPMGNVLEIVIKEPVSIEVLPDNIVDKIRADKNRKPEDNQNLFTRIWLEDGSYHIMQEAANEQIEESYGTYRPEFLPWLALGWERVGNYSEGLVGEYLGDFQTLERLWQALTEGSEAMAKIIFLANPNGVTRATDVAQAKNLDVVNGRPEDIVPLQVQKYADFQVVSGSIDRIEQRLALAFLLNSSIQRQAERVTAEEIRYMAQELEDGLGGQYSVLSQEFQLPVVRLLLRTLMDTGQIPELPYNSVMPMITAGIEALGRTHEQARLTSWVQDCATVLGPETVIQRIRPEVYMMRAGSNYGVTDLKELLLSEEEVQQNQQQAMMNSTLQQVAPNAVKGMMDYGKEGLKQQQGAPTNG